MKKYLATTAAFMMAAGFMMAGNMAQANNATDHVFVSPSGTGDALIFPIFWAQGTIKTNIRVINTSSAYAQVAKVVLRDATASCELLDFLIYLTPNDVWTATLEERSDGKVYISSSDESSPMDSNYANQLSGGRALGAGCFNRFYPEPYRFGYIEVYGGQAFNLSAFREADGTVAKECLFDAFHKSATLSSCSGAVHRPTTRCADVSPQDTRSSLIGQAEVYTSDGTFRLPMLATAMANNQSDYKLDVGAETRWDTAAAGRGVPYGNNTHFETRAAMSKANVHVPYDSVAGSTIMLLTFPGKNNCDYSLGYQGSSGCQNLCWIRGADPGVTLDRTKHTVTDFVSTQYTITAYDNEEHTRAGGTCIFSPCDTTDTTEFENDIEIAPVNQDLVAGWIRVGFSDMDDEETTNASGAMRSGDAIEHNGSALIPSYIQQVGNGWTLYTATYDAATVSGAGMPTPSVSGVYQSGRAMPTADATIN